MKKICNSISAMALLLVLTMAFQTVAYATPIFDADTDIENNPYLVETITGQAAIEQLPAELLDILRNEASLSPYGVSQPGYESHRHNFTTDGQYDFYVSTKTSEIFSTKVFEGHDGRVTIHLEETCPASYGDYTFNIYKLHWTGWDAKIHILKFPQG